MNAADYIDYYRNQAGGGLPGYAGGAVMYGAGLGGLFRGLFRLAVPLLKRFKVQGSCLFVTYTIIQGTISSEM